MRTPGPAVLLGVLILILLAALAAWRPEAEPAAEVETVASRQPGAPPGDASAQVETGPVRDPIPPPVPAALPPDIAGLLQRAEAGDARAACRLGTRLSLCQSPEFFSDGMVAGLREQEAQLQAKGKLEQANEVAARLLYATEMQALCRDVPPELVPRAFGLLRQAALAGEPEAVIRYARGTSLLRPSRGLFGFLREPEFDTWRAEAIPMLEAAMRAGRPEAVVALLEGHSERGLILMLITPRDPVRAEAYRQLANRLFGPEAAIDAIGTLRADSAQQREAATLAERWHREHFAGRRARLADHLAGFSQPGMGGESDLWSASTDWKNPCNAGSETVR